MCALPYFRLAQARCLTPRPPGVRADLILLKARHLGAPRVVILSVHSVVAVALVEGDYYRRGVR